MPCADSVGPCGSWKCHQNSLILSSHANGKEETAAQKSDQKSRDRPKAGCDLLAPKKQHFQRSQDETNLCPFISLTP